MKLLEQYLVAVSHKLPLKGRGDIIKELRSLLQDDIEARFGTEASESQLKQALQAFGSPAEVAARYTDRKPLIAAGLQDLYLFLVQLLLAALALAFLTLFVLEFFTADGLSISEAGALGTQIAQGLVRFVGRTFNAWLSAVGTLTLGFIVYSHYAKSVSESAGKDWSVDELKDIETDSKEISRLECALGIGFTALLLVVMNTAPQLTALAESAYQSSGLRLDHLLDQSRFRLYMHAISPAWLLSIIAYCHYLLRGSKTRTGRILELGGELLALAIMLVMLLDNRLYLPTGQGGMQGFRLVILIISLVAAIELAVGGVKMLLKKASGQA